jgi:peptide methionine sulfoxide reductase msrA/msrB
MVDKNIEVAFFAGGCFWCLESIFEKTEGVNKVTSGYSGGYEKNPTYEKVCYGHTGHYEAVKVFYDSRKISYERLLEIFWKNIDPTDPEGQFCDIGSQYKTAIFYLNNYQKQRAEKSKRIIEDSGIFDKPIVTRIDAFLNFYEAEDYHQDYFKKCSLEYAAYYNTSGRVTFLNNIWSKYNCFRLFPHKQEYWIGYRRPDAEILKKSLSQTQYDVAVNGATERPFDNKYWDFYGEGIYVDVISGEPLFSSIDKFDSGTGWPSFSKPLDSNNIQEFDDYSFGMHRIELKSRYAKSHLGHVFKDGISPTGLRYCINSAALKFIEKNSLKQCGYDYYLNTISI